MPLPTFAVRRLAWYVPVLLCTAAALADPAGKELFENNCASCHGIDGKARTPMGKKLGAKDLAASTFTDAQVEAQIRDGKKDARGSEKMPAYRERLSAADISAIVAYVKAFRPEPAKP